jgi:hypothetical protein
LISVVVDRRDDPKAPTGKFRLIFRQRYHVPCVPLRPDLSLVGYTPSSAVRKKKGFQSLGNSSSNQFLDLSFSQDNSYSWRSLKYEKVATYQRIPKAPKCLPFLNRAGKVYPMEPGATAEPGDSPPKETPTEETVSGIGPIERLQSDTIKLLSKTSCFAMPATLKEKDSFDRRKVIKFPSVSKRIMGSIYSGFDKDELVTGSESVRSIATE